MCSKSICVVITVLLFSTLIYILLTHSTETFAEPVRAVSANFHSTPPRACDAIINGLMDDNGQKRIMERKLQAVKNDGKNFRYFNDPKKAFDNNSTYCYVNTFDYTTPDGAPKCDKSHPIYNFSMFKSVNMGAVLEDSASVPRQVCIFEVDKNNNVFSGDAKQFATLVNNFDNAAILQQVNDCKSSLSEKTTQYNTLLDEHTNLMDHANKLLVSQEECSTLQNKYIQQSTLLAAALEASDGKVVLVDTSDEKKRIVMSTDGTQNTIEIPVAFNMAYAYVPSGIALRFENSDGTFTIYDRSTSTYPLVDSSLVSDLKSVSLIRKASSSN